MILSTTAVTRFTIYVDTFSVNCLRVNSYVVNFTNDWFTPFDCLCYRTINKTSMCANEPRASFAIIIETLKLTTSKQKCVLLFHPAFTKLAKKLFLELGSEKMRSAQTNRD